MSEQQINKRCFLPDEHASIDWAEQLASHLKAPLVLTFSGDLGAGKTTIIRALLRSLGIKSAIKSPTFSLVESYRCPDFVVHHFDLYRIHHEEELEYIGFRDFFSGQTICCLEWPEQAGHLLPQVDVRFKIKMQGSGRALELNGLSPIGEKIVLAMQGQTSYSDDHSSL